jgi:hypothetical protein
MWSPGWSAVGYDNLKAGVCCIDKDNIASLVHALCRKPTNVLVGTALLECHPIAACPSVACEERRLEMNQIICVTDEGDVYLDQPYSSMSRSPSTLVMLTPNDEHAAPTRSQPKISRIKERRL